MKMDKKIATFGEIFTSGGRVPASVSFQFLVLVGSDDAGAGSSPVVMLHATPQGAPAILSLLP